MALVGDSGTKLSPAYTDLCMGGLEERLLQASMDKPLVWMGLTADVFFIWVHKVETLVISCSPNLKTYAIACSYHTLLDDFSFHTFQTDYTHI